MASLVPLTREHLPAGLECTSTRTSVTHIETSEAETNTEIPERTTTLHGERDLPPSALMMETSVTQLGDGPEPDNCPDGPRITPAEVLVPPALQVYLTFLVISGRRRTMSFEPQTTLGRVKELVWNSWPNGWEDERPLGPSYLRVLYLGKMLQDDDTLAKLKFPVYTPQLGSVPTPTIVHLSIRPFAPTAEGELKKKRNRTRSGDGIEEQEEHVEAGCCGCVIC